MRGFSGLLRAFKQRYPRLSLLVRHPGILGGRVFYRTVLLPFRRVQKPGSPVEDSDLLARTDEYNAAAERYFAEHADASFLLDKPFSDVDGFAEHLIRSGTVIAAGSIRPGDTVVEIGAGTCWLSQFLNRYGCRTVSVDVSRTALTIGRQLFKREPSTDWSLDPRFVEYDGNSLPLDDAMCDCVVIYDAFHHIPNQRALLAEMHRILRPRGIVVMSEPGVGHADTPASIAERETGVLENELVIADIAALAEAVGFHETTLLVSTPSLRHEIPADKLGNFAGGSGFGLYWWRFSEHLMVHHYILIRMAPNVPDTDWPSGARLQAAIRIEEPSVPGTVHARGKPGRALISVENRGDAVWMHGEGRGWTRLGGHLFAVSDSTRELVDYDWLRVGFDQDIEPGDRITVEVDLPAIDRPGSYAVELDMVLERVTWFAERGSRTATLDVNVE